MVPSRAEKKEIWVRWDQNKKNMENMKGVTVDEKELKLLISGRFSCHHWENESRYVEDRSEKTLG